MLFPAVAGGACLALKDEIEGGGDGHRGRGEGSSSSSSELAKGTEDPRTKELMLDLVRWEGYHKKILEDGLHHLKEGKLVRLRADTGRVNELRAPCRQVGRNVQHDTLHL